jgi:hypothetical protein
MYTDAVAKSLTLMAVALPTMSFVIVIFYVATKALHRLFPGTPEAKPEPEREPEPEPEPEAEAEAEGSTANRSYS